MRTPESTTSRHAIAHSAWPCLSISQNRATSRLAAACLVFCLFGLLSASSAKAQFIPKKCLEMQPHAKRMLDAGRLAVEGATSNNDYSQTYGCDFYVMEIAVPASSTPPAGFRPSFSFQAGAADIDGLMNYMKYSPTNDQCPSYDQATWVVKKSVANDQMMGPGGFKHVAWWPTRGVWVPAKNYLPPHCELRVVGGKQVVLIALIGKLILS